MAISVIFKSLKIVCGMAVRKRKILPQTINEGKGLTVAPS